ncbi:hypothetical protein ACUN9Y_10675 [Halomonas sp. V046]|uniref:hypothetical protein n=1 Tax=Halomonas sp. V046 TaxID=3459611 RepID=UPI004044B47C
MEDIFTWLGETLGRLIRFVVEALSGVFSGIDDAAAGFINGLSASLGISSSIFSLAALALGLFFIWRAIQAVLRRSVVAAILWALLGLVVLGTLIP